MRLPAILAGDGGPSADAPVGREAMDSISAVGKRANSGGDADEARSFATAAAEVDAAAADEARLFAAAAAVVVAAAAAAATDAGAVAVLADRLSA